MREFLNFWWEILKGAFSHAKWSKTALDAVISVGGIFIAVFSQQLAEELQGWVRIHPRGLMRTIVCLFIARLMWSIYQKFQILKADGDAALLQLSERGAALELERSTLQHKLDEFEARKPGLSIVYRADDPEFLSIRQFHTVYVVNDSPSRTIHAIQLFVVSMTRLGGVPEPVSLATDRVLGPDPERSRELSFDLHAGQRLPIEVLKYDRTKRLLRVGCFGRPSSFEVPPGNYRLTLRAIGQHVRPCDLTVSVTVGESETLTCLPDPERAG